MENQKIKIRLFIGFNCPYCHMAMQKIELEEDMFECMCWDAMHSENIDFCNEQNIDELPHMQILDEDDLVTEEYIGIDVLSALKQICGR